MNRDPAHIVGSDPGDIPRYDARDDLRILTRAMIRYQDCGSGLRDVVQTNGIDVDPGSEDRSQDRSQSAVPDLDRFWPTGPGRRLAANANLDCGIGLTIDCSQLLNRLYLNAQFDSCALLLI